MPLNQDRSDALDHQRAPIRRVYFDRSSLDEIKGFVAAAIAAVQQSARLVYIASIRIDELDRQAAMRIAWLRTKTKDVTKQPTAAETVGALGEWAVLRYLGLHPAIRSVSLVSLGPVPEPDFVVEHAPPAGGITLVPFDIKTTAAKVDPSFQIDAVKHGNKGDPHILGLRLLPSGLHLWESAFVADVFVTGKRHLMLLKDFQQSPHLMAPGKRLEAWSSLKGNVACSSDTDCPVCGRKAGQPNACPLV